MTETRTVYQNGYLNLRVTTDDNTKEARYLTATYYSGLRDPFMNVKWAEIITDYMEKIKRMNVKLCDIKGYWNDKELEFFKILGAIIEPNGRYFSFTEIRTLRISFGQECKLDRIQFFK